MPTEDTDGPIRVIIKQHLLQALLVVAFGAWSVAVWSTKQVVQEYLEVQSTIEGNQRNIIEMIAKMENELIAERQTRREELLLIRERQDRNTSLVNDHDQRIRILEQNR